LKPAYDEVLGVQFKVTEWLTAAAPDPESEMAKGELVALLVTVALPERLPVLVGANVTLKEVDCPAARVTGRAKPAALNPASDTKRRPGRRSTCTRTSSESPMLVLIARYGRGIVTSESKSSVPFRNATYFVPDTGTIGRILKEDLPEWQSWLRAQAEQFAVMRAQSESPLLQILFWLAEYFCRFLAGLIAGVLAGCASHLTLDFFTPMSLPVL
jgi:hypothetical protein